MPEKDSYIPGMSAVRFVRFMAELSGIPRGDAMERAHEALFMVGLGEAKYRPCETFSLGMKQRMKLAQAIAHGPRLLFLDEPTNGLDPRERLRMIELLRSVQEAGGMRLVISSHLLRDVEETCDEVLILKDGMIASLCNLEEERRRHTRFFEIDPVGDDRAGFTGALVAMGCECADSPRRGIKVVVPDNVGVRDLYRAAAARGVQIRRLAVKRDSLEEIFVKAMGGRADGGL